MSDPESGWTMVTVDNISAGGVLLLAPKKIDAGTALEMEIFSDWYENPLQCLGHIKRVSTDKELLYRVAVEFSGLDEDIERKVNDAISDLESPSDQ